VAQGLLYLGGPSPVLTPQVLKGLRDGLDLLPGSFPVRRIRTIRALRPAVVAVEGRRVWAS